MSARPKSKAHVDFDELTRRIEESRGPTAFTPAYLRRSNAITKYSSQPGARHPEWKRYRLATEFAKRVEAEIGRHVTPLFFRFVHEALARGLKAPSDAEMEKCVRYTLDLRERGKCRVISLDAYRARIAAQRA